MAQRHLQSNIGGYFELGRSIGATKEMNENHALARDIGRRSANQSLLKIGMQVAGLFIGGPAGAAAGTALGSKLPKAGIPDQAFDVPSPAPMQTNLNPTFGTY